MTLHAATIMRTENAAKARGLSLFFKMRPRFTPPQSRQPYATLMYTRGESKGAYFLREYICARTSHNQQRTQVSMYATPTPSRVVSLAQNTPTPGHVSWPSSHPIQQRNGALSNITRRHRYAGRNDRNLRTTAQFPKKGHRKGSLDACM